MLPEEQTRPSLKHHINTLAVSLKETVIDDVRFATAVKASPQRNASGLDLAFLASRRS